MNPTGLSRAGGFVRGISDAEKDLTESRQDSSAGS